MALLAMMPSINALAQKDPDGVVVYSLPQTNLTFDVDVVCETFHAGPYAAYASKFLGIEARTEDAVTYSLEKVVLTPFVEADNSARFSVNVPSAFKSTMLTLSTTGLVSLAGADPASPSVWRFPAATRGDFSDKGVSSNLSVESATLYHNAGDGFDSFAVQQSIVVEKSLEKKAKEAADMIFKLREYRVAIITGDTDMTYDGEAMGSAVAEMTRLEKQYMAMFVGYSDYSTQSMRYEVIPAASQSRQTIPAFRISESAGLVAQDDPSGAPVMVEIIPDAVKEVVLAPEEAAKKPAPSIRYRTPAICSIRLVQGKNIILQTRVPVYQMGVESSIPVSSK